MSRDDAFKTVIYFITTIIFTGQCQQVSVKKNQVTSLSLKRQYATSCGANWQTTFHRYASQYTYISASVTGNIVDHLKKAVYSRCEHFLNKEWRISVRLVTCDFAFCP